MDKSTMLKNYFRERLGKTLFFIANVGYGSFTGKIVGVTNSSVKVMDLEYKPDIYAIKFSKVTSVKGHDVHIKR